jgi:hypothetical protein
LGRRGGVAGHPIAARSATQRKLAELTAYQHLTRSVRVVTGTRYEAQVFANQAEQARDVFRSDGGRGVARPMAQGLLDRAEVATSAMPARRDDRLEDPAVEAHGVTARAERDPEQRD